MEFRDLKKQYQVLKSEIDEAVGEVIRSGNFILGQKVSELEQALAEYVGVKHCITCANGTDALTLALKVWGIGEGDAVFVPDFTFFSSAEVVSLEGATPVFVDVDERTFNIDPVDLERKIEAVVSEGKLKPKVVVAVDLFGQPADYNSIRKITEKHGLLLLEDGAQGFGGQISDKKACSFGDISTTSFFPAKPLGCYGDGGAVFTDNDEWASLVRSYRVHGKGDSKYDNVRIGLNSRLDAIQAAVLLVKLKAFKEFEFEAVNKIAERYTQLLGDKVRCPKVKEGFRSSWAQYTIQFENKTQRDKMQEILKQNHVPTMIYYQTPMHKQTAFKELNQNECPVSERLSETVLSLPMHPYLTEEDVAEVARKISQN